jgi:hypothetical protein
MGRARDPTAIFVHRRFAFAVTGMTYSLSDPQYELL